METELAVKILFYVVGLLVGLIGWLGSIVWKDVQKLKCDITSLKDDVNKSVDDKFNTFLDKLDEKLDSWWNKIENNLMNDGRLPPKNRKKGNTDG